MDHRGSRVRQRASTHSHTPQDAKQGKKQTRAPLSLSVLPTMDPNVVHDHYLSEKHANLTQAHSMALYAASESNRARLPSTHATPAPHDAFSTTLFSTTLSPS